MHYIIDEIRIIWVLLQLRLRGAGGGEHRKCKIYDDVPPKMGEFYTHTHKSVNMGPILTPMHRNKNLKHAGQICKKSVKKSWRTFGKWVYIV